MRVRILILLGVFFLVAATGWAAVPRYINFQGRLTNSAGVPIVGATSNVSFKLYSAVASPSVLWAETKTITSDNNGIFNTLLGDTTALTLDFSSFYWLGITVGAGGTEMTPRQQLVTVPYAFRAATAEAVIDNAITTAKLADGAVTLGKIDTPSVDPRYVNVGGDTMTGTLTLSANSLLAGTNQLVLVNTRAGIGTTEPQSKLDIEGDISGGGMLIASAAASTDEALAADYSTDREGAPDLIRIPVYISPGTTNLRGRIKFKAENSSTNMEVWFVLGARASNRASTTSTNYVLSDDLLLSNVSSGWQELIIYGTQSGGRGGKVFVNSFAIYTSN